MTGVELNDVLLAKLAGWEAVKAARSLVSAGKVTSAEWQPPMLKGVVQEGTANYRAGLSIRSASDADNLCTCRDSRQRGLICAHSVAVGLQWLKDKTARVEAPSGVAGATIGKVSQKPASSVRPAKALIRAETGEPLELHVIFPPNFEDAVGRGKVMLYCEGSWRKGRAPLNALPFDVAFKLSPQDAALVDAMEALNGGDTPAMMMLNAEQLSGLLLRLVDHPHVTLGKAQSLEVHGEPLQVGLKATLEPTGEIFVRIAGGVPGGVIRGAVMWVYRDKTIRPLGLPAGVESLLTGPMRIPRTQVPQFLNITWPQMAGAGNVQSNFALEDFSFDTARPVFKLHLAGGMAMLEAKLECVYGGQRINLGVPAGNDALWMGDPKSSTHYLTRDFAAEQAALARLTRHGFAGPDAQGLLHVKGQNLVLNFFAREYPRLEKEWEVTLEERLEKSSRQNLERIEPRFQITPLGEQWFDLNVAYGTEGGERFSASDIQRLLLSGQSHTRLKNGKFAIMDTGAVEELQEVLLDCAPTQHAAGYRIDARQSGFLDSTLRQQPAWQVNAPGEWKQRAAQQRGEVALVPPDLGELESVLRPYQKQGVGWLNFLRANGFGGILADEMGLGKTLQVLAFLSALRSKERIGPCLVVCPTSLLFNWAAEAAKFTPGLPVLVINGPRRQSLFSQIPAHALVITSYGLLRRDAEQYRALEFDTVVLDEAQHIKNRQTQNAQAVKSIRTQHRLVLTGTPLENSVLDLWSIFDFLMPGYLGNAQDFRERYETPITRDKSVDSQKRLARRLRPFMLRRLKREVAADLPEKIEQVSYCELSDEQRSLYQQVLDASRREILEADATPGNPKGRMLVLTALLRLRQICCDVRLLNAQLGNAEQQVEGGEISGKTELFGELLEEVIDGGHRVLVFSQFTSMLALLREQLDAQKTAFCYLDGETRDRAQVVEKFQKDAAIPVFLISLKAGGVGLNLTGADTVIHFDPWWNPAVEAQATDRAHRIGQKKVVTSYKLITRGTVEEKILNLQARKKALFEGMLGDEEQMVEKLSWDEIRELITD